MPSPGTRKRGATWYAIWSEPHSDTGLPRRVERRAVDLGEANSQRGAERARRAQLTRLDAGLRPSGRTVAQLVARYIAEQPDLKPRTRYIYGVALRKHIAPQLGATLARELSPGDVRGWHVTLARAGYAPGTIRLAHNILSGALGMEYRDERLPRNVAALVPPPSTPPAAADPPAWDEAEIVRFIAAAATDPHEGALWTLLILTGLRIGEALALTWAHVDLDSGALSVRQTRTTDDRGRPMLGTPKSDAGRRDLLLPPDASAQLRAHRDRAAFAGIAQPTARVFPFIADTARKRLRAFCAAHGFDAGLTPHDLRHIHISWLTAARMDPLAIIARVGHSNLAMLREYAHLAPGSAAALNTALGARLDAARAALDEDTKAGEG